MEKSHRIHLYEVSALATLAELARSNVMAMKRVQDASKKQLNASMTVQQLQRKILLWRMFRTWINRWTNQFLMLNHQIAIMD